MSLVIDRLSAALGDRYGFEREIGAGGMATVYLAQDLKHRRQVAVKVLRTELAAALGAERFRREIEIAAGLHHPHILPLFDSGEADGLLFYVMPFEEGETLRARLQRDGKLTIAAATRLMRDVADALAHAHTRGVVHRDIKPENVLCSGSHALVTDFGIAKALSDESHITGEHDAVGALTQVGTSIGTPAYMAPEQIAGDPNIDHRADLYALGVMAYEALTGAPPFGGESPQQVLAAHLSKAPEPLAARRPDVPPALATAVMRCLEKEPAARWQSAADLVSALEAVGDTGSRLATGTAPRRRWPIFAAAAVLLLAVGGSAWYGTEGRAGTLIGDEVLAANDVVMVAEFSNRTNDSTLAETVTDAVRIEMQQSSVVKVVSQSEMWAGIRAMTLEPGTPLPDAQVRELSERLGAKAFVVGDVAPLGGGFQLTARVLATVDGSEGLTVRTTAKNESELIGALGELGEKLRRGIGESIRSVASAEPLARVTTASLPALRAYSAGGRAEDLGDRPRAIALLDQAVVFDTTFAVAWNALGIAHANNGNWPDAMRAVAQAWQWRESVPERNRLSIEVHYHELRGDLEKAVEIHRQQTQLYNAGWTNYSNTLAALGRLPEAEDAARRGIEERPRAPTGYWNLAEAQVGQGNFAGADSTVARLAAAMPESQWPLLTAAAVLRARRNVDSVLTYYQDGPGRALDRQITFAQCWYNLEQGKLNAFHRCGDGNMASSSASILAELRMTGDTTLARERLRQLGATGVDSLADEQVSILIAAQAEAGDVAGARRTLQRWRDGLGADHPVYRSSRAYALGAIAVAEQQYDSAATLYLEWHRAPSLTATHLFNKGLAEAGLAIDRAGNPDSALVLLERALAQPSITGGTFYEVEWYPQVLRRLGELYEARGNRTKALAYYGELVDRWRDADPVLQPQVRELRARIAALGGDAPRASSIPADSGMGR